jgi:lipoprotein-anchoring transpeptidase ErfK/SrfK
LGERFHINPQLLAKLNTDKDLKKAGEQILAPNVQRDVTSPADRVVVSKSKRTVTALAADGTILAQYPATIGSEHDPLPLGDWKITGVQQNPVFNYNPDLFWDAKADQSKARIPAGPNNPVGVVWIGLSKEHYGIHGTPSPHSIGHTESHGCIRLTNWDAKELSQMVKPGVPAILQE